MSIDVAWDDPEHTRIIVTYSHDWTWPELYDALEIGNDMVESAPHPVGGIHDVRALKRVSARAITHIPNLTRRIHPNSKITVFVSNSALLISMYRSFERMLPASFTRRKIVWVDTLDAARATISAYLTDYQQTE